MHRLHVEVRIEYLAIEWGMESFRTRSANCAPVSLRGAGHSHISVDAGSEGQTGVGRGVDGVLVARWVFAG